MRVRYVKTSLGVLEYERASVFFRGRRKSPTALGLFGTETGGGTNFGDVVQRVACKYVRIQIRAELTINNACPIA